MEKRYRQYRAKMNLLMIILVEFDDGMTVKREVQMTLLTLILVEFHDGMTVKCCSVIDSFSCRQSEDAPKTKLGFDNVNVVVPGRFF